MSPNDCRPGLAHARAVIVFRPSLVIVGHFHDGLAASKTPSAPVTPAFSKDRGSDSGGFSERPRSDDFLSVQRIGQVVSRQADKLSSSGSTLGPEIKASRQPNTPATPPAYRRGQVLAMCPALA